MAFFVRLDIDNLENVFLEGLNLGTFKPLHRKIKNSRGNARGERNKRV